MKIGGHLGYGFHKNQVDGFTGRLPSKVRGRLLANLAGVNQTQFSIQLASIVKKIKLSIDEHDLRVFVASRNKLVHEGQFYCKVATSEERQRLTPMKTKTEEWLHLVSFLDKVMLATLGFEGQYIDWSVPNCPESTELKIKRVDSVK